MPLAAITMSIDTKNHSAAQNPAAQEPTSALAQKKSWRSTWISTIQIPQLSPGDFRKSRNRRKDSLALIVILLESIQERTIWGYTRWSTKMRGITAVDFALESLWEAWSWKTRGEVTSGKKDLTSSQEIDDRMKTIGTDIVPRQLELSISTDTLPDLISPDWTQNWVRLNQTSLQYRRFPSEL
jgi:hypothetical protein